MREGGREGGETVCSGRKCRSVPCSAAARATLEQMNPFHLLLWQLLHGASGRSREGRRVAGGVGYTRRKETRENDGIESGR